MKKFLSSCFVCFSMAALTACGDEIEYGVVHEEKFDTNRLVKVQLASDFDEPMEIAITPESKVIIVERKGAVKLYNPVTKTTKQIAQMDVYSGQEDGLLGVALDPNYEKNKFIYFYYSPAGSVPEQRVSRFVFDNDSLVLASEKILINIPTQRQECCHSAGSIAFGPNGNLFIAVGDNTNPHNPGYYNSIDERKGRENWDAQRTAGNTNDLRGKILRIHPEPDGTYTIPEGNLFKPGTDKARPEIYAMGTRNPYRIAVDQKKGWLYWGDVGQNTIDNPERGPISYDEWHVATAPGFFGWPYFAGPNSPYTDFDFETNTNGPFYDPEKPINNSVNNTGLTQLPPATGAMIWYSYDESKLFPHLGTGGKSPIAGPVFYTDLFKERINDTTRHLHEYFNGKVFIAEWMRDWINVVDVNDSGKVENIEPFMRGTKFSHPIELEFGPDGTLYILEYGTNWFSKNKDAGLFRVEYLRGKNVADTAVVKKVDNAEPKISFQVKNGNSSFYWPGVPIEYSIDVTDPEDGSLREGKIEAGNVRTSLSYTTLGTDLSMVVQAHENLTSEEPDFAPIKSSDCKSCHATNRKSVGPSYVDIANKYKNNPATVDKLASKIINGGAGVWGEHAMSAHPQLSGDQAKEMVRFILGLNNPATATKPIAPEGTFTPGKKADTEKGDYIITVSYNDKGAAGAESNAVQQSFFLRHPELRATSANLDNGITRQANTIAFTEQGSWIMIAETDLTGINSLILQGSDADLAGTLVVKAGTVESEEIGKLHFDGSGGNWQKTMNLKKTEGRHDIYIMYNRNEAGVKPKKVFTLSKITFSKN